jgi:hypothetical protein
VVKLIAQRCAVGATARKLQLLDKHGDELVGWGIVGEFDGNAFVFSGVEYSNVNAWHK